MLYLPLRLIQSALSQKAEAKLVNSFHRESSQGRAAMRGHEVASLPGEAGLHMGQSQRRASPFLAKSGLSGQFQTGRVAAYAGSGAPLALVLHAITSCEWSVHPTDEVPRRLGFGQVSFDYKSHTKGQSDAPVTGTVSLRPRFQGCQQQQSKSSPTESQNRRKPVMALSLMGIVSRVDYSHQMARPCLLWATQPIAKKHPLTSSDFRGRQSANLENPSDYHPIVPFPEWDGSRASWVLTSGVLGACLLFDHLTVLHLLRQAKRPDDTVRANRRWLLSGRPLHSHARALKAATDFTGSGSGSCVRQGQCPRIPLRGQALWGRPERERRTPA